MRDWGLGTRGRGQASRGLGASPLLVSPRLCGGGAELDRTGRKWVRSWAWVRMGEGVVEQKWPGLAQVAVGEGVESWPNSNGRTLREAKYGFLFSVLAFSLGPDQRRGTRSSLLVVWREVRGHG